MVRKLFLLSLLGSVYFSEISQLAAMDPPVSDFSDEEQHLTHLPLKRESIEETIEEISGYLTTSIEYSQRKLAEIESIYQLYQAQKKAQARREFNNLFGDGAAPNKDKGFLTELNSIKNDLKNIIIYNANSFLRELNENIDGKYRYPRNFIGAGLIFAAAEQEIRDHEKTLQNMSKILEANAQPCFLAGKTATLEGLCNLTVDMAKDEIVFYSYLKDLSYPFFKENSEKNPVLCNQIIQRQVDTFKALRLSHAEAQKKEEQEKIKAQKLARAKEAQEQSKPQGRGRGRGRGKARKGNQQPIKKEVQELVVSTPPAAVIPAPIIEELVKEPIPSTPVEIKPDVTSVAESIVSIIPVEIIDKQKPLHSPVIKAEDNYAPLETETQMDPQGAVPIVSAPPVIAKEEESYLPLKEVPQIREDKHEVKLLPQNKEIIPLSIGPTYETTHIAPKYKELFKSMFNNNIPQNTIEWQSVMSMMENMNGFNGKMYGSGGKRQFAVFLLEKQGEPTKFVTLQDYEIYLKDSKKVKLEYKIVRKVAHTESPHSRGGSKEGTRYMYPTLVKLFVSSLEKVGLTPQKLGW